MSAERGWIGEPLPMREWHMRGWVETVVVTSDGEQPSQRPTMPSHQID
jgi:hypothetical protein